MESPEPARRPERLVSRTDEKPPTGVTPRNIWEEKRAAELARAIHEYVGGGFIGGDYRKTVLGWVEELDGLLRYG